MNDEVTFSPILDAAIEALQKQTISTAGRSMMFPEILFCTVTSIAPLELKADDFGGEPIKRNIVVSEKITDHDVVMIADPPHDTSTESGGTGDAEFAAHKHTYSGGLFNARYGLREGDKVVVIRFSGGQRHWVVDRVGEV